MRYARIALYLPFLCLLVVLTLACGGSDSKGGGVLKPSSTSGAASSQGSTTSNGSDPKSVAHAALLKATDLPGNGWQVARQDSFDVDTGYASTSTAECKHHGEVWQDVVKAQSKQTGRASITLALPSTTPPVTVQEWVEVYGSFQDASDVLAKMRTFLGDEGYTCEQQATETAAVHITRPPSSVKVPNDGAVLVQEVNVPAAKTTVRREYYYWLQGNTAVTLIFTGGSDINAALVQKAVDAAQNNLKAAAK